MDKYNAQWSRNRTGKDQDYSRSTYKKKMTTWTWAGNLNYRNNFQGIVIEISFQKL